MAEAASAVLGSTATVTSLAGDETLRTSILQAGQMVVCTPGQLAKVLCWLLSAAGPVIET